MKLRLGTRPSPLALKQVEELGRMLPSVRIEAVPIKTEGDIDKVTPISEIEGSDFFTRQIDRALRDGDIDAALHSAKDLPDALLQGLKIAAITESIDPHDALVSKGGLKIHELKPGARIGASSLRRKSQLSGYRSDLSIVDIRGTIGERLKELDEGDLDAVIIAAAALIRLGLEDRITQKIPFEILKPHPLQGALAVEIRDDDEKLAGIFEKIDARRYEKR